MEADSHLGLTNRLLAPFARRVCLAFPIEGRDSPRYLVTGRPVPAPADRPGGGARRASGSRPRRRACSCSAARSARARSTTPRSRRSPAPASTCCTPPASATSATLESPGPHYDLRGYISDFGEALLASDLVVARSGGSVFEIAAHGRPAVLIPYPHATADHQTTNARFMERAGAAIVIPDAELTGPAPGPGGRPAPGRPRAAGGDGRAAAGLARPDAAREIARRGAGGRPRRLTGCHRRWRAGRWRCGASASMVGPRSAAIHIGCWAASRTAAGRRWAQSARRPRACKTSAIDRPPREVFTIRTLQHAYRARPGGRVWRCVTISTLWSRAPELNDAPPSDRA